MAIMKAIRSSFIVAVAFVVVAPGCRGRQLQDDQMDFRCRVQRMYLDQVMDNLIRADRGLPFVQLDYSDITGTATTNRSANAGASHNFDRDRTFSGIAVLTGIAKTTANAFDYGFDASQENQLTVTAEPVLDDNGLYIEYLRFVKRPDRLLKSPQAPPCGAAHIVRQCGDMFYWVPVEHKDEFLQLSMRATVLREQGQLISVPAFFETEVMGIVNTKEIEGTGDEKLMFYRVQIKLAEEVPNDAGKIVDAVINGRVHTFRVQPLKQVELGSDTNVLELVYSSRELDVTPDELGKALAGQTIRLELEFFRPPTPTLERVLKSVERETRLNRLNNQ